ncbi:hypothetical protein BLNAU_5138 [Blattamonas nauphoetae]|uniref:Uncharacterized protein n=1 Tax=Blattamonas nauphoetae TaxID=2049346 RepID=A0ABQ9Y872_9EUKA|nr:hypothetical protein BLNAU_5138 [Blattamonas nauphoetae]
MDCSPFMNWDTEPLESESEKAVVLRSLVATLKLQTSLDDSLETKAVKLLVSVNPRDQYSATAFLCSLASSTAESLADFVELIVVLVSSANQVISTASMNLLRRLFVLCSEKVILALVKADLIPQLMHTLNPLSLLFTEKANLHTSLVTAINSSFWLATPDGLAYQGIKDDYEQQAVHETVLKQVLAPSEQYIRHLCVNRSSIVDDMQSMQFMIILARLIQQSSVYQPTMDFVVNIPIFVTIPSCLTFFEDHESIWIFLHEMIYFQREMDKQGGEYRQMWTKVLRMLRMEGFEDVIEDKLLLNKNAYSGRTTRSSSDGVETKRLSRGHSHCQYTRRNRQNLLDEFSQPVFLSFFPTLHTLINQSAVANHIFFSFSLNPLSFDRRHTRRHPSPTAPKGKPSILTFREDCWEFLLRDCLVIVLQRGSPDASKQFGDGLSETIPHRPSSSTPRKNRRTNSFFIHTSHSLLPLPPSTAAQDIHVLLSNIIWNSL